MADFLALRDSTVSQHLALLRKDGLVSTRRDGQTIWYAIASTPARKLVETLYHIYCAPAADLQAGQPPRAQPQESPQMTIKNLDADDVARLLKEDAIVLIDVREPAEYAAERIHGALLFPLSTFDPHALAGLRQAHRRVPVRLRRALGQAPSPPARVRACRMTAI